MNRDEILQQYTIVNGRIKNPGKFEGEPIYTPYFWDAWNDGLADVDEGDFAQFNLQSEDFQAFPELQGCQVVHLTTDDAGFVYCKPLSKHDEI
jgi:hypothetical protein